MDNYQIKLDKEKRGRRVGDGGRGETGHKRLERLKKEPLLSNIVRLSPKQVLQGR